LQSCRLSGVQKSLPAPNSSLPKRERSAICGRRVASLSKAWPPAELDQASVSKIENRSDTLLSTLRSYVEAMGGSLRLVAEFPDGVTEVSSLGSTDTRHPISKAKERAKPQLVEASDD
jgi:hypothetical protein